MGQLKGRKVRNLGSGRFYCSKNQMKSAPLRRANALRNYDRETYLGYTALSIGRKVGRKRSRSAKAYYARNPGEFSRRMSQVYKDNPELVELQRRNLTIARTDMPNRLTDPDVCYRQFNTSKEGVLIIRKHCVRERDTGVAFR